MILARKLAQRLVETHPADAATALETLSAAEVALALPAEKPAVAARVLQRMTPHRAAPVLEQLPGATLALVLDSMPSDTAAALLRRSDAAFRIQVLESLSGRTGRTLRNLLKYATDSAATRMDPDVVALPEDLSVEQAMQQVREAAQKILFNVYVVDRNHVLVGVLNLRELLSSQPQLTLQDVMKKPTWRISAEADRQAILEHPGWREVHSLPVIDAKGRFLGALRYRALQRLQNDQVRTGGDKATVTALGELFRTGAAGALNALTTKPGGPRQNEQNDGN